MKYPILKNKMTYFPSRGICPVCKKKKIFEPHSMVIFSGGACFMDKSFKSGGPHPRMEGFLSIHYHGAHDKGEGKKRNIYKIFDIAKDIKGGQYDLYFCSLKCFRVWFNNIIDNIRKNI